MSPPLWQVIVRGRKPVTSSQRHRRVTKQWRTANPTEVRVSAHDRGSATPSQKTTNGATGSATRPSAWPPSKPTTPPKGSRLSHSPRSRLPSLRRRDGRSTTGSPVARRSGSPARSVRN